MSTDSALASPSIAEEVGEVAHDDHDLTFGSVIRIAIFLALVTGLETLTYFVDFGAIADPLIIFLMVVKFATVVAYFMHLRYDNWLFTLLFLIGVVMSVAVYIVAMVTMQFFQ